jgi:hypothetical protein
MKPTKVLRNGKHEKVAELLRRAEDARRRAELCDGAEQLMHLRRMQDFKKLAEESEH